MLHLNAKNFDETLSSIETPVLVDFFATWCGPCKMMTPVLEKFEAANAGKVQVAKVDIDESMELAERYGIQSVPTLAIFSAGKPVKGISGAVPQQYLQEMLDGLLNKKHAE